MNITIFQLFFLFLFAFISGIDSVLDEFQFHRPILICPIIGLILGDLKTGLIIGGTLEMIVLGWMNIGAAISPDSALAAFISTILVIVGKQSIGTGIGLSIPLSITGQALTILIRTFTIFIQHLSDKYAKNNNTFKISLLHIISLFIQGLRVLIPVIILSISLNTELVNNFLKSIPYFIINGLNISGGIIVIVGYSMIINMIKSNYLMPFFYLGFIISGFTNFNLISLGIMGVSISYIYIQLNPKYFYADNSTNKNILKNDELD